ncbi:hypothetical protein [Limnovirga soli]|uniref:Uncharacterized protein n=1 Tax=Limnovirga soli TaxID=2656915 RepID=A0A8J8FBI7_9BACT|nr:hypothetical protein [Limnovirga soli]NNV54522.1 hypothetical protein [Limnovirga soli]
MALDKDILGTDLYNELSVFNNKNIDELGDIEDKRLLFCKKIAEVFIEHLKANVEINIPGTGLIAPGGAVTGNSTTGTIN